MKKKYIVEAEEGERLYKTKLNALNEPVIREIIYDREPYIEPNLEQVRKEAYEQGRKDVETQFCSYDACKNRQEEYQRGLADAWEAARKIGSNSMYSLEEMGFDFSRCAVPDYNPSWFVVKNYSAQEALEEIRAHEQAQKEKEEQEEKDSVTTEEVMRHYLDTFCKRNFCTKCILHTPDFTCGRGYSFLTSSPVSDEEVRRAYAAVIAKLKE